MKFDPIPIPEFIAKAVNNNPQGYIEALVGRGYNPTSAETAAAIIIDLYQQGDLTTVEDLLNTVPFIDRGDWFSNWVFAQVVRRNGPQQRASIWELLGGVLSGIGGVLTGDSVGEPAAAAPPPPPPPPPEPSGTPWLLIAGLAVVAIYVLR
ncbi:MAG TPA: hypothetical protein HPP51_04050 [Planctomycetes bacterium]|nr:hypothetical protein [Planctomycetota bacterium]